MSSEREGLTAAEAATRLGVKRQTLYAYVSRGLLSRVVAPDGRTSLFDPAEIERVRQRRRPDDGELTTFIATALTRVDDRSLLIRGHDLVALIDDGATFADVVDLLWDAPADERWTGDVEPRPTGLPEPPPPGAAIDGLRIVVARLSAADPLRHELSDKSTRAAGRRLITALSLALPPRTEGSDATVAAALWRRLAAAEGSPSTIRALDVALGLLVDHGLASSTFAARIAASVRADPYSVVTAGLGVVGGTLHGAASGAVHELLATVERTGDAATAAGEVRRATGAFPGFGHTVYTDQDPRYGALMARIADAWGDDPRLAIVHRLRDLVGERTDHLPNVDLALGALTFLARMPADAGEVVFATARTAGWLAHAMEEYREKPLRFRPRARYLGPRSADVEQEGPDGIVP